jgi:hypothetical protein
MLDMRMRRVIVKFPWRETGPVARASSLVSECEGTRRGLPVDRFYNQLIQDEESGTVQEQEGDETRALLHGRQRLKKEG